MKKTSLRKWKKVFESDLSYVAYELKDLVGTPALILIEGPMGAGKTTFSKVMMEEGESFSPTYSVLYESGEFLHGDFYRIEGREDIIQLELPLYLEDKNFFLAEWGLNHLKGIDPELPEEFSIYLLNIDIVSGDKNESPESRNFELFKIQEI